MHFTNALYLASSSDGSYGDGSNLDNIIAAVKDLEITPERIREFLPKVNWGQLASLYVKGRSGAECETCWLNHEDPLINRNTWTAEEDKNLLFIVLEKGIANWFDIAVSLGSNRTPFQCLARYQRSLNACILKREWTEEEDNELRTAVEVFGECDWQSVASVLKGRTGTQCSNRWKKSLHPTRQRVGRWTRDEDKCLKVAVMLFGPKNWRKIAEVVPGRTQVQCRERWVNSLDPALNSGIWTEEEDLRLEAAIEEHGYCWSKIATCMPSRTDNQCWRRWKMLHPEEVPLLQEARRIRKATLISNFVNRVSERPALGPNHFNIPLPKIIPTSEPENTNLPSKEKRKKRGRRPEPEKENDAALRHSSEKRRRRRSCRKGSQASSVEVPEMMNENEAEIETASGRDAVRKKRRNPHSKNNNCSEPAEDVAFPKKRKRKPPSGSNSYTEPALDVAIQKKRRRNPPSGHTNCSDRVQDDAVQTEERKQESESNKCMESMQDNNSSSHPLSTLCMTTNHEADSFGSSLTIKRKKNPKPSPKQCSKRRVYSELGEEQNSVCCENNVFSGGTTDGAEAMQNSGVEVDILGVDDVSRKKSTAKPGSKRKTCMNLSTFQNSNKNTKKRGNSSPRQHCRRRKSNEPSGDEDDIMLASFLQDKLKKRIPSLTDGDERTLASFLCNKPKKVRHRIVENAHLSTLKVEDQCSKINQMRFGLQHSDGVILENSTFHCSLKQTIRPSDTDNGAIARQEVVREAGRIDEEGNFEADDINYSCVLAQGIN